MTQEPSEWDRRRKPRYAVTDIVEVYVAGADGRFVGCAVLRDVSQFGVGVHMEVPLTPGMHFHLTNEKGTISIVCRHVKPSDSGYVMGLEFIDCPDLHVVSAWLSPLAVW